jgi:chloramphenicol-sensitive protein RarD
MANQSISEQSKSGAINAVWAYFLWGIAPLYFKLLADVSAPEILVHRIIWSFVLLAIVLVAMGNWRKVQQILRQPKILFFLCGTSILLGANWLVFIWAVSNGQILEASLGYYINPLFNVLLGMIFFGERLRKWQIVAVSLAFIGVLIQLFSLGTVPLLALFLASSFAVYGMLRKKVPVDSVAGLYIESGWLLPISVVYWLVFIDSPTSNMFLNDFSMNLTLIAAGLVTTAPLLFFIGAAKRLTLAVLGFFQYIGPSLMFIIAVTFFDEALVFEKMLTFVFIWAALLIFSLDSIKHFKKR